MIVAADGSGDFTNLQDAVDSVPVDNADWVSIRTKPGVYRQKVSIHKPFIRLVGDSARTTILTWDDGANRPGPDDRPLGTFRTASVYVTGHDFRAEHITFENSAGEGSVAGQALAADIRADRASFWKCRFLGCQDTLFTGPVPEQTPAVHECAATRQYYQECYIRGDVDFIFGSAAAVFDRCEIFANERGRETNGYLTAASTPEGQAFGYVFLDCRLTSDARPATFYLGRPWRDFAQTAFIRCYLGSHIKPEGWCDWNKPYAAGRTVKYAEYGNYGPGADPARRVQWAGRLTSWQAAGYTMEHILAGDDHWVPPKAETDG